METGIMDEKLLKQKTTKQLLWIGVISIVMLFAAFTSAYVVRRDSNDWQHFELPEMFYISTAIILLSSASMNWAQSAIKKNNLNNAKTALLLTLFLGIAFAFSQYLAWGQLHKNNIFFMGKSSHAAGSFLYFITLMHVLHVLGGLIALLITFFKASLKKYSATDYLGIQLCSIYWHFLDVLWIYLFVFLFFMR